MGGDYPPLQEYVRLAKAYNAMVYVDDAHGFGIIGENPDEELPYGYRGNGIVRHFGLDYEADQIVYIAGLSKAFSSYAAFVTCFDDRMKAMLRSTGPFVFSGPTCVASLASALAGLRVNRREGDEKRRCIYRLTKRFVTAVEATGEICALQRFDREGAAGRREVGAQSDPCGRGRESRGARHEGSETQNPLSRRP